MLLIIIQVWPLRQDRPCEALSRASGGNRLHNNVAQTKIDIIHLEYACDLLFVQDEYAYLDDKIFHIWRQSTPQ